METNIPTINELKMKNGNSSFSEDMLYCVISLITIFSNFRSFLEQRGYDEDYELPTIIFGQIIDYMEENIKNGNIEENLKLLSFLDVLALSKNNDILDLVVTGFLENLDINEVVLNFVRNNITDNLLKLIKRYFPNYL